MNDVDEDEYGDQVKEVFAHFGLAIYQAQCLEHGIVNALVYLDLIPNERGKAKSAAEWEARVDLFMDSKFELTLGRMIRSLAQTTGVAPDLQQQLTAVLAKRNWLVHDYFRERAETFMTATGMTSMISELESVHAEILEADRRLDAAVKPAREATGLTDSVLDATCREMLSKLRE